MAVDLRTTLQRVRVASFALDRTGVVIWLNAAALGWSQGSPLVAA